MSKDKVKMEEYRQQINKKYKDKITELENRVKTLSDKKETLESEIDKLKKIVNEQDRELCMFRAVNNMSREEINRLIQANETTSSLEGTVEHLMKAISPIMQFH